MKIGTKLVVVAVLLGLVFSFSVSQALAQEQTQEVVTQATAITIKGKIICLGCTLKKEQGAGAQCSIYGHKNALLTADGKIWTILENDASTELINSHEYAGKEVEITGKEFTDAQVIEVESFKVIEE